jgi:heme iron utilization protein
MCAVAPIRRGRQTPRLLVFLRGPAPGRRAIRRAARRTQFACHECGVELVDHQCTTQRAVNRCSRGRGPKVEGAGILFKRRAAQAPVPSSDRSVCDATRAIRTAAFAGDFETVPVAPGGRVSYKALMTDAHAAPPQKQQYLYDIDIPTPSHAERARTLVQAERQGTICTLSTKSGGHPYGSLVTYAMHGGQPIFLLSGLAEHTQNLKQDARASLLVSEAGDDNPLALGRVTLVGRCNIVPDDELEAARGEYLARHPDASYYADFSDFNFWRLEIESLRYIGGFGRMSWVEAPPFVAAEPDPVAAFAAGVISHMNDDHVEAMTAIARAFSKAQAFSKIVMTGVDRYGFEVSVQTSDGNRPVRFAFDEACSTAKDVREQMVQLTKKARAEG